MTIQQETPKNTLLRSKINWLDIGLRVGAVILALAITSIILLVANAQPLKAYWNIVLGAFSSTQKVSAVIASWVPLVLATSGLLFTFTAGLWNIGMEGQIVVGLYFA
jgi:simple sugar transport system permease protein